MQLRIIPVAALLLCQPAAAQTPGPAKPAPDQIIITSPIQQRQGDSLQSNTVLNGAALAREVRSTLGETLARQPGVSSTSYGPGASRPVLRGFQGERIRVLVDGIGSIDVSNTSPDHAVASEPLTATRIEILRGPATLLYGSSAIGGVVNQIDSRIANGPLASGSTGVALASFGTAANESSLGAAVDIAATPNLIVHADGNFRDSGNLGIPGFARSAALRAGTGGTSLDDIAGKGRLLNSFTTGRSAALGLTGVSDTYALGASVALLTSTYGVPGPEAQLDPVTKFEGPRLDMRQVRADIKGALTVDGALIRKLNLRAGYADYRHFEIAPSGDIGTTFTNKAWEARLEIVQQKRGQWQGASGVQVFHRNFAALGDEAFVPQNFTDQAGLFTVQDYQLGKLKLEGGLRYEVTRVKADSLNVSRTFNTLSGSIGGLYAVTDDIKLGVSLQRTARAPAAEELFANGPHAGTRAFEIGNPNFRAETALGGDVSLHADFANGHIVISGFYSQFHNYVYERATGRIVDDLTEFQFEAARARYLGVEAESELTVLERNEGRVFITLIGDLVRADNLTTGAPLPRIPAARVLMALSATNEKFSARAEVEFVATQNRISTFELPTRGYNLVSLQAAYRPFGAERNLSLELQANNIFNADARRHASFLKDFAPVGGRDVRLSLRAGF